MTLKYDFKTILNKLKGFLKVQDVLPVRRHRLRLPPLHRPIRWSRNLMIWESFSGFSSFRPLESGPFFRPETRSSRGRSDRRCRRTTKPRCIRSTLFAFSTKYKIFFFFFKIVLQVSLPRNVTKWIILKTKQTQKLRVGCTTLTFINVWLEWRRNNKLLCTGLFLQCLKQLEWKENFSNLLSFFLSLSFSLEYHRTTSK